MVQTHASVALAALLATTLPGAPACWADGCPEWRPRPAIGPSPRGESGFAFDAQRARAVLVGGANTLSFASVFRETWELDGSAWSLQSTDGPSARCDNAVAYDSVRHVTLSFGGFNGGFLGDTWEWNGTAWSQHTLAPSPSPRADSFMVFDQARGVMVLFGGLAPNNAVLGDTWEWDGAAWAQRSPATSPPARWIHRMAYDTHRSRTVLFGGARPSGVLADAWEFDGTTWAPIPAGPGARYGHAMAYDSDRQITLLFGGQNGFNFGQGVLGDTWEFDGAAWTARGAPGPAARTFAKMVYDSSRRRAVLFGGYSGTQFIADTWELGEAYANCDNSTTAPLLNVGDFTCFLQRFAAADSYANCDESTTIPVLNVGDFTCFLQRFAAGCP
jgi:hypothetical protein